MKSEISQKISVSICVYLWLIFLCFSVNAQIKEPKTVADYYLLLPDAYLGEGYEKAANRRSNYLKEENGSVIARDDKNGYLQISGDGARPMITVALFKKSDGKYLVGVTQDWEMGADFYMLSYDKGKWKNITKAVVPRHTGCENEEEGVCTIYELPRVGTIVAAMNNKREKIYELIWNKGKFTVRK